MTIRPIPRSRADVAPISTPSRKHERDPNTLLIQATERLYRVYEKTRKAFALEMESPPFRAIGVAREVSLHAENKELIGEGVFAKVHKVYDFFSHEDVALKVSSKKSSRLVKNEAQNLADLNHRRCPNIAQLFYFYHPTPETTAIGMRLEAPSLMHHMRNNTLLEGRLPLADTLHIAHDLLEALAWLGRREILHGDLSPSNIAYNPQTKRSVLIDFGLARRGGGCGGQLYTAQLRAPEVILGSYGHGLKADIWALGGTLHWIYTGRLLFKWVHEKTESPDILHQTFALIGPPDPAYLQTLRGWRSYCRITGKDVSLHPETSPQAKSQVAEIQSGLNVIKVNFDIQAQENGEDPKIAIQFGEFVQSLLTYEDQRPDGEQALAIFKKTFGHQIQEKPK